jgi:aminoglycoside phosphotransferase (APT) family kinase protein
MTTEPIARGRAADVFADAPGRVLRRYRDGADTEREARVMEHARRHGFPVPAVHDARGPDLVLERIAGPTMLADLARRPWRVRIHARTLADLHRRLHAIAAPPGLPSLLGDGPQLVHVDLHPDNVLLGPQGPVVIDWQAAGGGEPADDVALAWVIMTTSEIPGPWPARGLLRAGRQLFVDAFVAHAGRSEAQSRLARMAAFRLDDPHLRPRERDAVRALAGVS